MVVPSCSVASGRAAIWCMGRLSVTRSRSAVRPRSALRADLAWLIAFTERLPKGKGECNGNALRSIDWVGGQISGRCAGTMRSEWLEGRAFDLPDIGDMHQAVAVRAEVRLRAMQVSASANNPASPTRIGPSRGPRVVRSRCSCCSTSCWGACCTHYARRGLFRPSRPWRRHANPGAGAPGANGGGPAWRAIHAQAE